ncbi:MAG: LuxR C-terminal-related transcriptional regulator [Actinomycetes bacterium]
MALDLTAQRVLRDVDVVARAGLALEEFLEESLDSVARAVPHVGACFATVDPSTLLLTGTLKFGELSTYADSKDHEWGLMEYGTAEPTSFIELAHRAVPAVATAAQSADSPRLNEFMRPNFGFADELRVVLRERGECWGGLAIFRGEADDRFDEHDVELLASLSEAMSVGVRTAVLGRLAIIGPGLPPMGPAVVIIGADDQVVQMSAGAEERLGDLLTHTNGSDPSGIITSLVGAARRFARGETARPPRSRVRARSGMWLVLHATPLTPRAGSHGEVVVTIEEARPPEIVPLVVAAFDLTQRERDVTERVLQGMDTKEIAASMHLSSYTVQDHLKSVFTKADVRSRRELIARVYFDQYVPRMGTDIGPSGWFAATDS